MTSLRIVGLWMSTAFRASPWMTTGLCLSVVITSVLTPVSLFGISRAIGAYAAGDSVWPGIATAGGSVLITSLINSTTWPIADTVDEKVVRYTHNELLRLTAEIPSIAHHEDPKLSDRVGLIERDAWRLGGIYRALSTVGALSSTGTVVVMLLSVGSVFALMLVVAVVPSLLDAWGVSLRHRMWLATERFRRVTHRSLDVLTAPRQGLEVRCFGLWSPLRAVIADAMDMRNRPWMAITRRFTWYVAAAWIGFGIAYALAVSWLISGLASGNASVSDVSLLLLIGPQIVTTGSAIANNVRMVVDQMQVFGRYQWLRSYSATHRWSDSLVHAPSRLTHGIRFADVSFTYPSARADAARNRENANAAIGNTLWEAGCRDDASLGTVHPKLRGHAQGPPSDSETEAAAVPFAADSSREGSDRVRPNRDALRDVDIFLPAGTTVAFIGPNGAGKSTLVKLLARLYDPTAGAVLIDGVPLSTIDPQEWRKRISAGFQDFATFEFLVADTIGVGDLDNRTNRTRIESSTAAGQAEPVVQSLASGLDTQLGSGFEDGVGLSGGQWQRLALARAFMRQEPLLMMLDEPTAALDPEAEQAVYEQYAATARQLAQRTGAVTILVSHRFSTVRMADLIVVVEDGEISELGSHAELLRARGRYAQLFDLQAQAYR